MTVCMHIFIFIYMHVYIYAYLCTNIYIYIFISIMGVWEYLYVSLLLHLVKARFNVLSMLTNRRYNGQRLDLHNLRGP